MSTLVLYQKHKSITFEFLPRHKNGNTKVLSLVALSTYCDTKYKVQQGLQISVTEVLKQSSQETVNKEDHLKSMLLGLSKSTDGGVSDPPKSSAILRIRCRCSNTLGAPEQQPQIFQSQKVWYFQLVGVRAESLNEIL